MKSDDLNKFFWTFILILGLFCRTTASDSIIRKHPSLSEIKTSEEKFYKEILPTLSSKQIALVTNPSGIGISPEKLSSILKDNSVNLKFMFGLEHGFLGLEEEFSQSPVTMDSSFNVPIYHIYKLKPFELVQVISEVNTIVIDVQDMGMRCYTYLSVLKRIMDASAGKNIQVIVLDHANPSLELGIHGDEPKEGYENFVNEFPLPFFTGLTMGESALYYNAEFLEGKVNLLVVPVENYKRSWKFEKMGLVWHTPSPNLPNLDSARNYQSLVFLEGINISVGRGTQAPFVYFGAPWIKDPEEIGNLLNESSDKKYYFQPVFFRPSFGPHKDKICRGLRMTLVDTNYNPLKLAYNLIKILKEKYKSQFSWSGTGKYPTIDYLWGGDGFRKSIDSDLSYEDFYKTFMEREKKYEAKIKKYMLYSYD